MSSFEELDHTLAFLKKRKVAISILRCTTAYHTQPENYGLNVIRELKVRYGVQVGYSDHSAKIETYIAAAALGAEILEFHVVFSRNSLGPDAGFFPGNGRDHSIGESCENIDTAFQHPVDKSDNSYFTGLKNIFEESLAVIKALSRAGVEV